MERKKEPCRRGGWRGEQQFSWRLHTLEKLAPDRSVPIVTEEESVSGQEAGDCFKEEAVG